MATLDQLVSQMAAADMPPLPPGHPVFDGAIHRFGPKKKAWYILREYAARNGKRYIVGAFGIWHGTENNAIPVKADFTGMDPDEYQRLQRSHAAEELKRREKRERKAGNASNRARGQWLGARARLSEGEAPPPYLLKKRLQWENGLRVFTDGTLLVPMVRYDVTEAQEADPEYRGPRRLVGLQKILPDGFKLFNKGMDPVGAACRFGPKKPKDGELLLLGEGVATVLSVHQGLERAYASFCAFNAGNLLPVARILRTLYPRSPILMLADDDAYLEAYLNKRLREDYGVAELYKVLDGEKTFDGRHGQVTVQAHIHEDGNGTPVLTAGIRTLTLDPSVPIGATEKLRTIVLPCPGRTKAWEAAAAVGNAWVTWPKFASRKLELEPEASRLTDFNDLHVAEGIERVVEQVGEAIQAIDKAYEFARALREGAAPAEGASGASRKDADHEPEPDWRLQSSLLRRFTLIERSDMAWDQERGFPWKVAHMRLTFGVKAVGAWLASNRRRSVDLSQVVFDPTGRADPRSTVNLFRGLAMSPKAGACDKLLKLLRYLCGEEETTEAPVSDWVLNWCAYQVQHPGAKMKTAIVMFGAEGTGKNLFWSALLEIFNPYSVMIGQAELEDKHNAWMSAKLFVVANEVVTRSEMSHHVGRLKALVTEDRLHINAKFQDQRYEGNHMNLVFLSNEFQPLKISPGDRRYMLIRTPSALEAVFYKAVAAELAAGGAAAFMHYLLERELSDFNEHTKPLMTEAKADVTEIGMVPSQLFWQEVKAELVSLPYCPALADDVYRAYRIWCERRGHKMPEAQNRFTPAFMSMNGVRRHEFRLADPENPTERILPVDELRKRRVFVMGERPAGMDERTWVANGVKAFRSALRQLESEFGESRGRFDGGAAPAGQQERVF
jgi:putative DNA primase/helicase